MNFEDVLNDGNLTTNKIVAQALGNKRIDVIFVEDFNDETNEETYVYYKIGSIPKDFVEDHVRIRQSIAKIEDKNEANLKFRNLVYLTIFKTIEKHNKSRFNAERVKQAIENTSDALLYNYYSIIENAHTAITDIVNNDKELADKKKELIEHIMKMMMNVEHQD